MRLTFEKHRCGDKVLESQSTCPRIGESVIARDGTETTGPLSEPLLGVVAKVEWEFETKLEPYVTVTLV